MKKESERVREGGEKERVGEEEKKHKRENGGEGKGERER